MATHSPPTRRSSGACDRNGSFIRHEREFEDVLGDDPRLELVAATDAHEGPVYVGPEPAFLEEVKTPKERE
jgi:hypothetical protein